MNSVIVVDSNLKRVMKIIFCLESFAVILSRNLKLAQNTYNIMKRYERVIRTELKFLIKKKKTKIMTCIVLSRNFAKIREKLCIFLNVNYLSRQWYRIRIRVKELCVPGAISRLT